MNNQHTPGPWWVTASGVRDRGGYVHLRMAATRYEGQDERYANEVAERKANECLIAAAPELLAALQCTIDSWTAQFERNGHLAPAWCKQARTAIAKATGPGD